MKWRCHFSWNSLITRNSFTSIGQFANRRQLSRERNEALLKWRYQNSWLRGKEEWNKINYFHLPHTHTYTHQVFYSPKHWSQVRLRVLKHRNRFFNFSVYLFIDVIIMTFLTFQWWLLITDERFKIIHP